MSKLPRVLVILAAMVILAGLCWSVIRPGGRRFQGRTESEWTASLANAPVDKDIVQWRSLGPRAVPMLCRALGKGTSPVAKWYQASWYKFRPWLKRRLPMPRDPVNIRRNAPLVMGELQCDLSPAVPALGRALRDEDPDVRANAAKCLCSIMPGMGPEKAEVVPNLIAALQDTNHLVRENATQCLGFCPEKSRLIGPALARSMKDSDQFERYLATMAFDRMDLQEAARGGAGPLLLDCLMSTDMHVRINAANKLSGMKDDPAREVPALIAMLNDYQPGAQSAAANALGRFGALAAPAVPALRRQFESGEPRVRNAASNALVQIDPTAAAEVFAALHHAPAEP